MTIDEKLAKVCEGFCIKDTYLRHELIQVGNVNKTYRVVVRLDNGSEKSFLVQNLNTYVFKRKTFQTFWNISHQYKRNEGRL